MARKADPTTVILDRFSILEPAQQVSVLGTLKWLQQESMKHVHEQATAGAAVKPVVKKKPGPRPGSKRASGAKAGVGGTVQTEYGVATPAAAALMTGD